jgi:hypothetical protein
VHDKKAEWTRGVLDELEAAGLVTLADKGYQGSAHAKIGLVREFWALAQFPRQSQETVPEPKFGRR